MGPDIPEFNSGRSVDRTRLYRSTIISHSGLVTHCLKQMAGLRVIYEFPGDFLRFIRSQNIVDIDIYQLFITLLWDNFKHSRYLAQEGSGCLHGFWQ